MNGGDANLEAALEEALAERARLWDELQRRDAAERELEHWREYALSLETSIWWRATEPLRVLRRALLDPAAAARTLLARLRSR